MELRHLRYFVAVAEELNFRRAAQKLNISQPPLTTQIQQLEHLLDVQLFERDKRRVRITAAGRELLLRARLILADVGRLRSQVASAAAGEVGELRVGYSESATYVGFVLETLQAFRKERPNSTISLFAMNSMAQLAALELGELDVGFVWALPPHPPDTLEVCKIWSQPFILAEPAGQLGTEGATPTSMAALADERFVTTSREGGALLFRTVAALCRAAGFTPDIVQEAPTLPAVLALVASGAGVSIVPAAMTCLKMPGVNYRTISDAAQPAELCWVSRRDAQLPLVSLLRTRVFQRAAAESHSD